MTETIRQVKSNMTTGRAWAVVVVVFLAGFCMPANMGKTMWIAPLVMESYGFGTDVLGWVNGVFYILGALIAFPAGSFVRRLGIRNSVAIALVCGIIGNIIGALSGSSVAVLMVSRIVEGAGFGLMGVIGVVAITPWFPKEKRGLPLGIWAAWCPAANAVTPVFDSWLAETTGNFMTVWYFFIAFNVVVLLLFLAIYRDPSEPFIDEEEKTGEAKFNYGELFKNKAIWVLAFVFCVEEGAFLASQGFLSSYVNVYLDAPLMLGTGLVSAGAVWGMCFSGIAGKISDAIRSRRKVLIFCMVSAVLFGFLVFYVTDFNGYILVILLNGFAGGGTACMLWAACSEVVPSHLISGATAALACSQNIGMFIGSMFMGNVINAVGYTLAAWYVLVPCFTICLLVVIFGLRGKLK